MSEITHRPGTHDDTYATFYILEESLADLLPRLGINELTSFADPAALERIWQERRPLFEHLARTAYKFWVAEANGEPVGFARSTLNDGVLELTEFFVKPNVQSAGLGKSLLEKVFPKGPYKYRVIIATMDLRAQARYLKSGVYPRFPLAYFGKTPASVDFESDLNIEALNPDRLDELDGLDEQVIGFKRRVDHEWLVGNRQGWLYLRDGKPVGYGYTSRRNGPFALLEPEDFPVVLAHAENQAMQNGYDHFGVEVPMINQYAVDYLLSHGFVMDGFIAFFMSDVPFGKFDQYIVTSPPFFM